MFDGVDPRYKRVLWTVIVINGLMFLTETMAGQFAGSQALKADALDFFADTVTYGLSLAVIGRKEEAIVWLRRSIEANRNNPMSHFSLATALAALDRLEESRAAARAGITLNPQFTIARLRASSAENSVSVTGERVRDRFIDGLRKAGVPE